MDEGAIPEKFGDYLTLRDEHGSPIVLGSGGFGTTVCAYRSRVLDGKEIRHDGAIKILRAQAIKDPKRRRSFIDEIIALSDLQHPNLVRYIDCGEAEGSIFMVMDLCRGGDLERLVRTLGPFSERAALLAAVQICAGLDEAHHKGYIHRDLKPRNVLLAEPFPPDASMPWLEEGLSRNALRLKIVDFGLAGRLGGESARTGFFGSPMFASPEQVRQRRDLDFRSDIYSLGMTLWFLVTGKGPLLRADGLPIDDAKEAMRAHTSPIAHDLAFPGTLTPEFRQLLSRMVKKPREERFGTLDELMRALRHVLERAPSKVAEPTEPVPAQKSADDLPPISLPRQAAWGHGRFGDYYSVVGEVGRRYLGKLYRAALKERVENQYVSVPAQTETRLTAWCAERSADEPLERELAEHLSRLWAVTWSTLAPPSLARILEVRRTDEEWCVCEEWLGGRPLEAAITARGDALTAEEVAALLMPVAEAADFLRSHNVDAALLDLEDIRLFQYEPEAGEEWMKKPVAAWVNWGVQVSALAVPSQLTSTPAQMRHSSASASDSFTTDPSQLPLSKSFARLIYRVLQREAVAEATDWDPDAYEDCPRLSEASNILLRDAICGAGEERSAVDLLRTICNNEGVFEVPASSSASASASRRSVHASRYFESTGSARLSASGESSIIDTTYLRDEAMAEFRETVPAVVARQEEPEIDPDAATIVDLRPPPRVPPPAPEEDPGPEPDAETIVDVRPPPVVPPAPVEEEEDEYDADAPTIIDHVRPPAAEKIIIPPVTSELDEAPIHVIDDDAAVAPPPPPPPPVAPPPPPPAPPAPPVIEVAELVEDEPQTVRSPYGGNLAQPIPGAEWRAGARIACAETGRLFQLPRELPPLEAVLIEGRFDSVLSPYEEPPVSFELPTGGWAPGTEITCPSTGLPLRMPETLPLAVGTLVPGSSGRVKSPFRRKEEIEVPAAEWVPCGLVHEPGTGLEFQLPSELPPLMAIPTPEAGDFTSPYAPEETFAVLPFECIPGARIACPRTGKPLVLPPAMPPTWKFEGVVRQGTEPEARCPFIEEDEEAWQPLIVAQWKPGSAVKCERTQRNFFLPLELPVLTVAPGEKPPSVKSPFAPHGSIAIQPEQWQSGAEFELRLGGGIDARVRLVADTLVPLAAVALADTAGCFISPYAPERRFILAADLCSPGQTISCPATNRLLAIPAALPEQWRFEGEVRQAEVPEALSPFVPDEAEGWQPLAAAEWKPGAPVKCQKTGRTFVLPAVLPVLEVVTGPEDGTIRSPFDGEDTVAIAPEDWVPCAELEVRFPRGLACQVRLPADILPLTAMDPAELGTLPQGFEAEPGTGGGSIRSPHGSQPVLELPGLSWLPGNRIICPETARPFWLPADLPPLEAQLTATPGKVISPYTNREVTVAPRDWREGELLDCQESGGRFKLPAILPLLIGRVDPQHFGAVESPFDPGKYFNIQHNAWKVRAELVCPATNRRFRLPDELPEWLLEAEIVSAGQGTVRHPVNGQAFVVPGEHWVAGGVIQSPHSGERLRLPAVLPPMEASIIPAQPGCITSPYASNASAQSVSRRHWRGGEIISCSVTGRPLRLPDVLPPLPAKQIPKFIPIAAAAVVLLGLLGGGGWFVAKKFAGGGTKPTPVPNTPVPVTPDPGPRVVQTTPVPTPPTTPVVPPPAQAEWPKKYVFPDGVRPASPLPKVQVVAPQLAVDVDVTPEDGLTVDLSRALSRPEIVKAASLKLSIAIDGYVPVEVPLKKVLRGVDYAPKIVALKRQELGVTFNGTPPPFYTHVRYAPADASTPDAGSQPISQPQKVPAGVYNISLVCESDPRFAELKVASAVAIKGSPARVDYPAFHFAKTVAGLTKREMGGFVTRFFKEKSRKDRNPTENPEPFTVQIATPEIIDFDDATYKSGRHYELNATALVDVVTTLDNICYAAAKQAVSGGEIGTWKNVKKASALADDFRSALEEPLSASPAKQRAKLRDSAQKIRDLLPKDLHAAFPQEAAFAAVDGWSKFADAFIALLDASRDDAWGQLIKSMSEGAMPPATALEKLTVPLGNRPGILVENKLTVQGFDGQKALQLKVDRYQGMAKPLTWLPTLEWNENAAKPVWKLTDRASGGEMNADLKGRP